jgi:hypothetical protein
MEEAIRFYCGINETVWNHHPTAPGPYTCVSPVYGGTDETKKENRIRIPQDTLVIQDSGAFCDGPGHRLSFDQALDRQMRHADKYKYADQITHRASYDLLIDEKWENGVRYKKRWGVSEAEEAVVETVEAAQFLVRHRNGTGLVLSAQGVDAKQYLRCAALVAPLVSDNDIFGLGGWCITGKQRKKMLPEFRGTMALVIPFLAKAGIGWVHIWGVLLPVALGELLWICDQHGIMLSTDSSGPNKKPALGAWGYGEWTDNNYRALPTDIRGLERARHVQAARDWLANFRSTKWYHPITVEPQAYLL